MVRELTLMRGEALLGTLQVRSADQPTWVCHFEATPAFEDVRLLFVEESRLLNVDGSDVDVAAYEKAYERIERLGLRLVPVDGRVQIDDFMLHVGGSDAWLNDS